MMKEILLLSLIYIIFFGVSLLFRKRMINIKSNRIYIYILIYLVGIYGYFELINWFDHFLSDRKIYLGFGHANLDLLLLCLLTFVTALFFIINIIYKRYRKAPIG
jgi:hypothetical protein